MSLQSATSVFQRVDVDHLVTTGGRIFWELRQHFLDPLPHMFQVQFSPSGIPTADDWIDVGTAVVNTFFKLDTVQHLHGKEAASSYRIVLTTTAGVYISDPAGVDGVLDFYGWRHAREIVRKETLRHRIYTSIEGFLLKARRFGTPCTACVDTITGDIMDSYCGTCYGTGFDSGFYDPVPMWFADVEPGSEREHRNLQGAGTERQAVTKGRFLGTLPLVQGDVWINKSADERYYIHTVGNSAAWHGVSLVFDVELRRAPYTDVIYSLPLP